VTPGDTEGFLGSARGDAAGKAPETRPLPAEEAPPPPPPPGSAGANTITFLVFAALVGLVLYKFGIDSVVKGLMVALGLGFVIFIHELGHFLAAKFCDVHVQTFSIGFGPALPGCSFVRGETTYKIAAIPLGGYVNMVGEGPEADEDENYPRSFKNKTVLARMLIISAGVIMNVLFAAVAFVIVYRYHGLEPPPAIVWTTEAGSASWEQGVRPGWKIVELDGKKDPFFDDLKIKVALSNGKRALPFYFEALPGAAPVETNPIEINPLRDSNNLMPMIGVSPPERLKLWPETARKQRSLPVQFTSAAARARALDLHPDDVPVATIGPASSDPKPLKKPGDWEELCERISAAQGKDLRVLVRADGKVRDVAVSTRGFDFGDSIVGLTDPATPEKPYNVKELPLDPGHDPAKGLADPFVFRRRLAQLAGKPVVIQVRRAKKKGEGSEGGPVSILVPPAYHVTFGLRMHMGKVAAVREHSPAEKADVQPGDEIKDVKVRYDGGPWQALDRKALDPLRLPWELTRTIEGGPKRDPKKWQVQLTVYRTENHNPRAEKVLPAMTWDDSWRPGEEVPSRPSAPLSIPQLGIAYWVTTTVADVQPNSPAARAGLLKGDEITHLRLRRAGKSPEDEKSWSNWAELYSKRGPRDEKVWDQWAYYFWVLQNHEDFSTVEVKVKRATKPLDDPFEMTAEPDPTWPLAERGLQLMPDSRLQKADSFAEALQFGLDKTWQFIQQIYLNLSSLFSGRISPKSLGGPIEIASQAFNIAGEDPFVFLLYLGIISINLAVVNFLPIPVLDGGHMVFLIYEGLRGRPPSEGVRVVATYLGLLLILALMVFVMYLDLRRRGWLPSWMM
jgi:regulator of sigma E protease